MAGSPEAATDPVCGMKVDPAVSKHRFEHDGRTFYFCSARCREKFIAAPASYLTKSEKAASPMPKGTIYTCPMHPQIRQEGPGNCPICGMALEPLEVTAETGPNLELIDMSRRFWIGLVLTVPVVALEMGGHVPALGLHDLVSPRLSTLLQFLFATPVVLWAGWPFFERAWASVVHRSLNMFSLIALGTGAAYLYSLVATFLPGIFPAGFRGMDGTVAGLLRGCGRHHRPGAARPGAGAARARTDRRRDPGPAQSRAKDCSAADAAGEDEEIPVASVQWATSCACGPATACRWTARCSRAEARSMSPWSLASAMPVAKQPGDKLIGGTVNGTGSLVMRADKIGAGHDAGADRRHGG